MFKKRIYKFVPAFLSLLVFLNAALFCSAQDLSDWKDNLKNGADSTGISTSVTKPDTYIALVIRTLLSLLGVIFLVLMVYGGMLWMTARGSNEQVGKAKEIITTAVIGLVIVVLSYSISYFIIDALTKTTLSF